jgi:hypothetical protein
MTIRVFSTRAFLTRAFFTRVITGAALATALTAGTLAVVAGPGYAASKPNPCKLLKTSEISKAFGGATVAPGKKGFSTSLTTSCTFSTAATTALPEGTVTVNVMTPHGKAAFKATDGGFQPVAGQKGVLWWDRTGSAEMLKGDTLIGVQGGFIGDTPPVDVFDLQAQMIALDKIALKRA